MTSSRPYESVGRPHESGHGRSGPLRVLVLAPQPFFQHRGTPIAVRSLVEVLAERGYDLHLLTYHEGEDVDLPGCEIHRIRPLPFLDGVRPGFSAKKVACDTLLAQRCFGLVRRHRFDLLHAVEESVFIADVMRILFGVPYVYDMDSSLAEQMLDRYPLLRPVRGAFTALERRAVRRSLGVVAVCESLEELARRHDPSALVRRIEDTSLLSADAGAGEDIEGSIGASGPIVMYVGNLQPYQGIDLLLRGFREALGRVPRANLVVIGGSDEDIGDYRRRAEGLGIGERVHFLGPRPISQLGGYLRQADVLASPRIQGTNTPMKIYSYMDSGRPVVATRLATHTQVLDDEIARLVEPEPARFGDGLATLLEDAGVRERLADAARHRFRQEYSPTAFKAKVERFYDAVEARLAGRMDASRVRAPRP